MTLRQELWVAWSLLILLLGATLVAAWFCELPAGLAASGGLPASWAPSINGLLLLVASVVSAWVLVRQVGEWAPLWVASLVFASMLGAAVFSTGLDMLFLTTTALGLAIVFRSHAPAETRVKDVYELDLFEDPKRKALRWASAGALLGMSVGANPLNVLILFAATTGVPRNAKRRERAVMVAGGLFGGLLGLLLARVFETTNPELVLATEQIYRPTLLELVSSPEILLRSLFELFLGRHIGLLVAFFPIVWALFNFERSSTRLRSMLLLAAGVILIAPILYRPFDFWLGENAGGSAGRELLSHTLVPIYPVFWFIGSRLVRPWRAALVILASLFLMGPAWAGAWLRPSAPGAARYFAAVAETPFAGAVRQWLPLETSQRALLFSGQPDQQYGQLWLRRVNHLQATAGRDQGSILDIRTNRSSTFLIASRQALAGLVLQVSGDPAPSSIGLDGGEVKQIMLQPDGAVRFEVDLEAAIAEHPSWWSKEPLHFYELRLLLPSGGVEAEGFFTVTMEPGVLLDKDSGGAV